MPVSLKSASQAVLRRIGLYERIKSSPAYDLFWSMADPTLLEAREQEQRFFIDILQGFKPGDMIFDIGANQGHKTDIFLRLGACVIAVDPDPLNQEKLRQSYHRYRMQKRPVTIVGKAVSDRIGVAELWLDEPGSAKNSLSRKWVNLLQHDSQRFGESLEFASKVEVATTTIDQLIQSYGRPFYIKIDVEGHERNALRGLHHAVPFISFEVNLPEFRAEAVDCIDLLNGLSSGGAFNYTADCCKGLALSEWLGRDRFFNAFSACQEASVEIFWKTADNSNQRKPLQNK